MRTWKPTALALALCLAYPAAMAQSMADVLKEVQELKARVSDLEGKLKAAEAKPPGAQWGMTPEQAQEFARVQVKTESIEDNLESWGLKGLTISGYAEPAYIFNKRQNRSGFQFLNDQADGYFYDTSFIGAASIDFTKETDSGTRYKLTLTPQRGVGSAIRGGVVQEATVSIPLSDLQTRLIAGQVPDWSGYEYQQPTLNPFTTHNLLYDFTLPFAYTGVGLDITRGKWWYRAIIANLNSTIRSADETSPVLAYRVDYSRGEFQGFGFAGVHGKVFNFATETNTTAHLFEIDAYFIRGDWTVQGQFSYGQHDQASINSFLLGDGSDARWYGVSGLAGYAITPRLQLLARADYLKNTSNGGGYFQFSAPDDRNGIGPEPIAFDVDGVPTDYETRGSNRYALTLGLKYALNQSTTLKAEYRYDGATRRVFYDVEDDNYRKNNHLLGGSIVVFF